MAGAVVLAVLLASVIVRQLARNEPLDSFARRVLSAMQAENADLLYDSMHDGEREKLGLNRGQFRSLLRWYRSCTDGVKQIGEPVLEWGQGGYILVVSVGQKSDSDRCDLELVVNRTADGPKCFLSRTLVTTALVAKYARASADKTQKQRYGAALLDGLAVEQNRLSEMGLRGYIDTNSRFKLINWDQLRRVGQRLSQP